MPAKVADVQVSTIVAKVSVIEIDVPIQAIVFFFLLFYFIFLFFIFLML